MKSGLRKERIPRNLLQILDANLNRAREGLRVLEDSARFVWKWESLFLKIRAERHLLDRLTRKLYPNLVASRNSREDRGRQIPEGGRGNMEAILFANFRRCEESLRCLEEYGKLFGPQGSQFKEIRYRIYDLEQRVCQKILK